jgi:hypothetical protein
MTLGRSRRELPTRGGTPRVLYVRKTANAHANATCELATAGDRTRNLSECCLIFAAHAIALGMRAD